MAELLTDGADVDEQDQNGYTALMMATDDAAITEVLLAAGAQVGLANKAGRTAIDAAVGEDVAWLLRAAGAKLTVRAAGYGEGSTGGPVGNQWTDAEVERPAICHESLSSILIQL